MIWSVPRMWEEGDVWILGGGPSVPRQFGIPEKVVQDVINGISPPSVYSPYMKALHDKHVIGINVAYLIGNWIDIILFGDDSFFLKHQKGLSEFPGLKVSCYPKDRNIPWVKFLARDNRHPKGISINPKTVSWNLNTGSAAISIAVHTGAKRIILLGFDMKLDENEVQHWHDLYGRRKSWKERNKSKPDGLPFERHLTGFPIIAKDAKMLGVEILNASPESAIQDFPKFTVKQLLHDNS